MKRRDLFTEKQRRGIRRFAAQQLIRPTQRIKQRINPRRVFVIMMKKRPRVLMQKIGTMKKI
jgi:hypothetical protein